MKGLRGYAGVVLVTCLLLCIPSARADLCPPTTFNFTENFTTDTKRDSTTSAFGWRERYGYVKLPTKTKLLEGSHGLFYKRLAAVAAGNFNEDGGNYDDIIGLVHDPRDATPCRLEYFENKGMSGGVHQGFKAGVSITNLTPSHCDEEGAFLRSGDIDGDGKVDLVFGVADDINGEGNPNGSLLRIFRNIGPSGGTPQFNAEATTLQSRPEDMRWTWPAGAFALRPFNDDTVQSPTSASQRWDAIVGHNGTQVYLYHACKPSDPSPCPSSSNPGAYNFGWNTNATETAAPAKVTLITDANFTGPFSDASTPTPMVSTACPPTYSRGFTVVLAEDFDLDGDYDLLLGSMSQPNLKYFQNNGSRTSPNFDGNATTISFSWPPTATQAGPTFGVSSDFNLDGYPDAILATDRFGCNGSDGRVWMLEKDPFGTFQQSTVAIVDLGNDTDWLVPFDADGDGDKDLLSGMNVMDSPYHIAFAAAGNVYSLTASAVSTTVQDASVSAATDTIVSVTMTTVSPAPTSAVSLFVTNNNGDDWEELAAGEIPPSASEHVFNTLGTKLRFKIEFEAAEGNLTGVNAVYTPGATSTPSVTTLAFSYEVIETQYRFSRSGLAQGSVTIGASAHEYLFAASSLTPGYEAKLQAFDITNCSTFSSVSCTEPCVTCPWEAGSVLEGTSGSSRTIYTAYDSSGSSGPINDRLTITLPLSATLQTVLATTSDADWQFVRDGMKYGGVGDDKKLYDIGHSTPVFVGPPVADTDFLDPGGSLGYATFKTNQASRTEKVYVGANDGMLHCFDAETGAETWAFVPYNLASRVKEQRGAGNVYEHDHFVDGPVVVRDVYDSGATAWKTVLIAGQGRGQGRGLENYYFALDVTDPTNPLPLWEFKDPWDLNAGSCDGDPCTDTCTLSCPSDNCTSTCTVVTSTLAVAASAGATSITIQAADWADFPSSGKVEIDRNDPLTAETRDYNKTSPDILNLASALVSGHGSGKAVWVRPNWVFQDSNGTVAIQAENYQFTESQDASHIWTADTATSGYTGNSYLVASPNGGTNCGDGAYETCGAELRYTVRFTKTGAWDVYFYTHYATDADNSLFWGADSTFVQKLRTEGPYASWIWPVSSNAGAGSAPVSTTLSVGSVGLHTFNVWMREDGAKLDKIVLYPSGSSAPTGSGPSEVCEEVCGPLTTCTVDCNATCVSSPDSTEWPECGVGLGYKCCTMSTNSDIHWCQPVGQSCTGSDTVLGETWSPPAVGRFRINGSYKYLAIFGSGYNSRGHYNGGRSIYAVDIISGSTWAQWDLTDLAYNATTNPSTIENTLPGGPVLVDVDRCGGSTPDSGCGYVDRIYIGDLEGRLWKIDTSEDAEVNATTGRVKAGEWPNCVLFDAGDYNGTGTRVWAPIITTPAAVVVDTVNKKPNVFFGTGGHDVAPTSLLYRFYSVRDSEAAGSCTGGMTIANLSASEAEWVIGDGVINNGNPVSSGTPFASVPVSSDYEGVVGDRYWSDPVIVNNTLLVFAALQGKIDSVDPCEAADTNSTTVYVYAARQFRGSDGVTYDAGDQIKKVTGLAKVRQAALARGAIEGLGFNVYATGVARNVRVTEAAAPTLLIGSTASTGTNTNPTTDPDITVIKSGLPGVSITNVMKILRWREIPL